MRTKHITNIDEIEQIINQCEVCFIAFANDNIPYVIPMNFAFHNGMLILHSAKTGKKIDMMEQNKRVSVAFSTAHQLVWQSESVACSYGMKSLSVVGHGTVEYITDFDKKIEYMNLVMKKYTEKADFTYSKPAIDNVFIFIVKFDELNGKILGY